MRRERKKVDDRKYIKIDDDDDSEEAAEEGDKGPSMRMITKNDKEEWRCHPVPLPQRGMIMRMINRLGGYREDQSKAA